MHNEGHIIAFQVNEIILNTYKIVIEIRKMFDSEFFSSFEHDEAVTPVGCNT